MKRLCRHLECRQPRIPDRAGCERHACRNPLCRKGFIDNTAEDWRAFCGDCVPPLCSEPGCFEQCCDCLRPYEAYKYCLKHARQICAYQGCTELGLNSICERHRCSESGCDGVAIYQDLRCVHHTLMKCTKCLNPCVAGTFHCMSHLRPAELPLAQIPKKCVVDRCSRERLFDCETCGVHTCLYRSVPHPFHPEPATCYLPTLPFLPACPYHMCIMEGCIYRRLSGEVLCTHHKCAYCFNLATFGQTCDQHRLTKIRISEPVEVKQLPIPEPSPIVDPPIKSVPIVNSQTKQQSTKTWAQIVASTGRPQKG